MVECCSYTVAECMKDAHVLVRLNCLFEGHSYMIEMLPILANMMYWVLGHFNLTFARDHS